MCAAGRAAGKAERAGVCLGAQDGRTGWRWKDRVSAESLEETFEPILYMWKTQRLDKYERFGDFAQRVGAEAFDKYVQEYVPGTAFKNVVVEAFEPVKRTAGRKDAAPAAKPKGAGDRLTAGPRKQQVRVTDELHSMLKAQAEEKGMHISDLVEHLLLSSMKK